MKQNKYVEVMYELYVPNETGNWDIVEKTSKEHPLKFVTGMDFALEAFENQIQATAEGDTFDFVVPVAEAYGDYVDEHVISLDKSLFVVDGQFDEAHIFPGNVIPLANEDGTQFNAVVEENIHARHLYERLGFVPLGVIPGGFRLKDGRYENICPYFHIL